MRHQVYRKIWEERDALVQRAKEGADRIGIPSELRGKIGLSGAFSSAPGAMRREVIEAVSESLSVPGPLAPIVDDIRDEVKAYYGDDYDAAPVCTCEAGLWTAFDVLVSPQMGRTTPAPVHYVMPMEKQLHHHGSYGQMYPPMYKDLLSDRGATSGEMGLSMHRFPNVNVNVVPLAGATYPVHGINAHPYESLTRVDPEGSKKLLEETALVHQSHLAGFSSMGYDTPGYGYGVHDSDGTPALQRMIGELASRFRVPYIQDNAYALPFIGTDIRKTNADVMVYSMDKIAGAPTSGLIIGKADAMVPIRRALGYQGNRSLSPTGYGQGGLVVFDPGKVALIGQRLVLKNLRARPEIWTAPVHRILAIIREEFDAGIPAHIRKGILVTPTYNAGSVEVCWDQTWDDGVGLPLSPVADYYCGIGLCASVLRDMGVMTLDSYVSPGYGTTDAEGNLVEDNMRYAVKAMVEMFRIFGELLGIW